MIKAISLRCFPSDWSVKKCIEKAKKYGFEGVEINFDGRVDIDVSTNTLKEIKKFVEKNKIKVVSVYSRYQWKTPISSNNREKRENGKKILKKLIEIAEFLECPSVLTIPGTVDNSLLSDDVEIVDYDVVYKRAKEILGELSIFAEKKGVSLSVENVPNKFLLSPVEMKKFIEEIGKKGIGCHFDIANCIYCHGIPEQWIKILNNYIKVVHIKDIRKEIGIYSKAIVNIFDGDINWNNVCSAFAKINYNGPLISEVLPIPEYSQEIFIKSISERIGEVIKMIDFFKNKSKE